MKPTSGEATIGMTTFSTMPAHSTSPSTSKSIAPREAPTRPPTRACDDDDGMPKYQVMRFHAMAPTTPANTMPRPLMPAGGWMMPLPTVLATAPPRCAPAKLPSAAMIRPVRGLSARVETEVAIALAASWNPLV